MTFSFSDAAPALGASVLPPPKSFAEASALVEAALDELRAAEVSLERQLSDLRGYMRDNSVPALAAPAVQ